MDAFTRLATQHPLIFVHVLAALGTLVLGAGLLARRKGTALHRTWGRAWVLLMASVVISSAFIRGTHLPNVHGVTPIHLLTLVVALYLPRAVMHARHGRNAEHRAAMRRLYIGGCIVAGAFALLPSRFLGDLLWHALAA